MEDGQESKDGVDQHGDDFALLVIEVGAGIATRTDGGVEDRRQLFAESKIVIIYHSLCELLCIIRFNVVRCGTNS